VAIEAINDQRLDEQDSARILQYFQQAPFFFSSRLSASFPSNARKVALGDLESVSKGPNSKKVRKEN
jgi:hypothetical protein